MPHVTVRCPADLHVNLVDAAPFGGYEVAAFLASLFASIASGFLVAGITATSGCLGGVPALFFALAGLFAALTAGAVAHMCRKRRIMLAGLRHVPYVARS